MTEIGRGSSGSVTAKDGFAVKLISEGQLSGEWLREISVMARVRHPCIVRAFGCELQVTKFAFYHFIRMELGDRDLSCLGRRVGWEVRLGIYKDVLRGLAYCHDVLGVIHRDLKPQNIILFLAEGTKAKIADFGMAAFLPASGKVPHLSTVTTFPWRAPELWEPFVTTEYGTEIDSYSVIVMGMELLFGIKPPGFKWALPWGGWVEDMARRGFPVKKMPVPKDYQYPKVSRRSSYRPRARKNLKGHEELFRYLSTHLIDAPCERPAAREILAYFGGRADTAGPVRRTHAPDGHRTHRAYTKETVPTSTATYATARRKEIAEQGGRGRILTDVVGMVLIDDYRQVVGFHDWVDDRRGMVKRVTLALKAANYDVAGIFT